MWHKILEIGVYFKIYIYGIKRTFQIVNIFYIKIDGQFTHLSLGADN